MFHDYDDILTVEELMEVLKIGKNTAYRLLNTKEIKSIKFGRIHRIPKNSLIDYIISKNK